MDKIKNQFDKWMAVDAPTIYAGATKLDKLLYKAMVLSYTEGCNQATIDAVNASQSEAIAEVAPSREGTGIIGVKWLGGFGADKLMFGDKLYLAPPQVNEAGDSSGVLAVALEALAWSAGHLPNQAVIERAIQAVTKALTKG